jgi:hypothetical protein
LGLSSFDCGQTIFGATGGNGGFGGGGGALGGAIFNDGGGVRVSNSTFTGNSVIRGNAGGGKADNGADGGGAIFSHNGHTTLLNVTISRNFSTGSAGGVLVFADSLPSALLTIHNSIIANNGVKECSGMGPGTIVGDFVGNLIGENDNCGGVVTSADPFLGPLKNNLGATPTMAITQFSSAFNAADPATSLATDQRGLPRPDSDVLDNGTDIGAFELCLRNFLHTLGPCIISAGLNGGGPTYALAVKVSPAGGGTTNPAPGSYDEPQNSPVALTATPSPGYLFQSWIGPVADPNNPSTTVTMDALQSVTANFVLAPACVNNLNGRGTPSGLAPARIDLTWTGTPNGSSYEVLRGVMSGGPYVLIGNATLPAFSDRSGLTNGNTYYYALQALDGSGTTVCQSNEANITIPLGH